MKGILYARLAVELIDNAFTTCMIKKVMDNRRLIIYTMTPLNLITNVKNQKNNGGIHREKFRELMPGWDGHNLDQTSLADAQFFPNLGKFLVSHFRC